LARRSTAAQGVTEGLITVLGCVEPCKSFSVRGGYADHLLHLELEPRQCLHLYFYCFHQRFGFMHLRLQTWFPFQVDLCLNGREWLCRELDAQGIAYRYLGRRLPTQGGRVPGHFQGEVISDLKERLEGTMNHPEPFRSYRRLEGRPKSPKAWRSLRRSVSDMPRRAEVSRAINARYATALASTTQATSVAETAAVVCRPVRHKGRRYRGLNPYCPEDGALLEAVSNADFVVAGLRNRDLQARLFRGKKPSPAERRRRSGRITRRLALLRAHGLLHKVTGTHRCLLTPKGRTVITALLAARQASVDQLNKLAA
jgi:hypothetical protein